MKLQSWMPDLPPYGHEGLVTARNVIPGVLGYTPVKALTAQTAALPAAWKGGGAFTGVGGGTVLLAATSAALYTLTASAATSVHTVATTAPWFATQFGDLVILTNGSNPVKHTIASGLAANLGGSPPTCTLCATVDPGFVFLAGNSGATSTVYWSGLENPEGWTIGTNQCDSQVIPDGGEITGIAGGQYALAFQQDAINVFEYVGTPNIFNRRKISDSIGAMCQGSIGQAGNRYFFKHRRGFYEFQDGQIAPIGEKLVDDTFATMYSIAEVENNLRCVTDPERQLVIWSMPDRLWVYNYELKVWSYIESGGIQAVTIGRTSSVTLEQIAVTYPSIEDVPVSFDDPSWRGGEPMLMVAKNDFKLHSFGSSSNLEAVLRLAIQEPFKGRETIVRNGRVDSDAQSGVTLKLDCAARIGASQRQFVTNSLRTNGDMPIRARGRYVQPELVLASGASWGWVQSFDLIGTAGGMQ